MRAEYWVIAGLILAVAEVVAPGTFLIFFAAGAVITGLAALLIGSLVIQVLVFVVATLSIFVIGTRHYRRLLAARHPGEITRGPLGEPGIVEAAIVNGRGKVRVRDISWLAAGADLAVGTPVVVTAVKGTLLEVRSVSEG